MKRETLLCASLGALLLFAALVEANYPVRPMRALRSVPDNSALLGDKVFFMPGNIPSGTTVYPALVASDGTTIRAYKRQNLPFVRIKQWLKPSTSDYIPHETCSWCGTGYISLSRVGFTWLTGNQPANLVQLSYYTSTGAKDTYVGGVGAPPSQTGYTFVASDYWIYPLSGPRPSYSNVLKLYYNPILTDYWTTATDSEETDALSRNYTYVSTVGYILAKMEVTFSEFSATVTTSATAGRLAASQDSNIVATIQGTTLNFYQANAGYTSFSSLSSVNLPDDTYTDGGISLSSDGGRAVVGKLGGNANVYNRGTSTWSGALPLLDELANYKFNADVAVLSASGTWILMQVTDPITNNKPVGAAFLYSSGGSYSVTMTVLSPTTAQVAGRALAMNPTATVAIVTIEGGGGVQIYRRNSQTWTLYQVISDPAIVEAGGADVETKFGSSVSVSFDGLSIAIGATEADGGAGRVYVYRTNNFDAYKYRHHYTFSGTETTPTSDLKCGRAVAFTTGTIGTTLQTDLYMAVTCGDGGDSVATSHIYTISIPMDPKPLAGNEIAGPACDCLTAPSGHMCRLQDTTDCATSPTFAQTQRSLSVTDVSTTHWGLKYSWPQGDGCELQDNLLGYDSATDPADVGKFIVLAKNLAAGRYYVAYIGGCMMYSGGWGWTVHAGGPGWGPGGVDGIFPGTTNIGWWMSGAYQARTFPLPGYTGWHKSTCSTGWKTNCAFVSYNDCQAYNKKSPPLWFDWAGGDIGFWLDDGTNYADNIAGTSFPGGLNPSWAIYADADSCEDLGKSVAKFPQVLRTPEGTCNLAGKWTYSALPDYRIIITQTGTTLSMTQTSGESTLTWDTATATLTVGNVYIDAKFFKGTNQIDAVTGYLIENCNRLVWSNDGMWKRTPSGVPDQVWPLARHPMYIAPSIKVDISGEPLEFTYDAAKSSVSSSTVVFSAPLPLDLTASVPTKVYYYFVPRTSFNTPMTITVNSDIWLGGVDAVLESAPETTGVVGISASTEIFYVYQRLEMDDGKGFMSYLHSLPDWGEEDYVTIDATMEWLTLKCGIGRYQVGNECITCPPKYFNANANYLKTPALAPPDAAGENTCQACGCVGCSFCTPTTSTCSVPEGFCSITDTCFERYQSIVEGVPCSQCIPESNVYAATAIADKTYVCDDKNSCTAFDGCRNGVCAGEPLQCLTIELTNDPRQNCEVCSGDDGCLPAQQFEGCIAIDDNNDTIRTCGCQIGDDCYPDGASHPTNECLQCDIFNNAKGWSYIGPTLCNDADMCTYDDVCTPGGCKGTTYECSGTGPCLESTECNGAGGCNSVYAEKGTICSEGNGVCSPNWVCDGIHGYCPPEPSLIPVITPGSIALLDAPGAQRGYPSNDRVRLSLGGYTVGCGDLNFTIGWYSDPLRTLGCDDALVDTKIPIQGDSYRRWKVGTEVGGLRTRPGPGVYDAEILTRSIGVADGVWIQILVKSRNVWGQEIAECVGPLAIDTTPPNASGVPRILDTTVLGGPFDDGVSSARYQPTETITFSWSEFLENSLASTWGGLLKYRYAIGSRRGLDDIVPWTYSGIGAGTVQTDPLLEPLPQGKPLFVTIRANNRAGLMANSTSHSVILDTTPVTSCSIFDGDEIAFLERTPKQDSFISNPNKAVSAMITGCVAPMSGIKSTEICWGTSRGDCDVAGYTPIAPRPDAVAGVFVAYAGSDVAFAAGVPFYATARVISGAGVISTFGSIGAVLDVSAPVGLQLILPAYSSSRSQLNIGLSFVELESVVVSSSVSVRAGKGTAGVYVIPPNFILGEDFATGILLKDLSLTNGNSYTACVYVKNAVGLSSTEVCATTIIDDAAPVFAGEVEDVNPNDISGPAVVAHKANSIAARWPIAVAGVSGIAGYAVRVTTNGAVLPSGGPASGDGPGPVEVLSWTVVDMATSLDFESYFSPTPGYTYYVSVRAVSGAGIGIEKTSAGVVRATTDATSGVVIIPTLSTPEGLASLTTAAWWPYASSITFNFPELGNKEAGAREYQYAVAGCISASTDTLIPWTLIPQTTLRGAATFTTNTVSFTASATTTYCVWMKGTTNLNEEVASKSAAFRIDTTPAGTGTVADAGAYVSSSGSYIVVGGADAADIDGSANITTEQVALVGAAWRGFTSPANSGIARYIVCVGTVPGNCDLIAPFSITADNKPSGTYADIVTLDDVTGRVFTSVTAVTGAGLNTTVISDGVTFDATSPEVMDLGYAAGSVVSAASVRNPLMASTMSTSGTIYMAFSSSTAPYPVIVVPSIATVTAPLDNVLVDIGTTPGGANTISAFDAGRRTSAAVSSVTLTDGMKVCASVTAVSSTKLTGRYVAPACVVYDSSPPASFSLSVRASSTAMETTGINVVQAGSVLNFCLTAHGDSVSGIATTTIVVGTSPYGIQYSSAPFTIASLSNLLPGAPTSNKCTTVTLPFALQRNVSHVASVTVVNGAGLVTSASSSAFIVEGEAPQTPLTANVWSASSPVINTYVDPMSLFATANEIISFFFTGASNAEHWASLGSAAGLTNVHAWTKLVTESVEDIVGPAGGFLVGGMRANLTNVVLPQGRTFLNIMSLDAIGRQIAAATAEMSGSTLATAPGVGSSISTAATVLVRDTTPPSFPSVPIVMASKGGINAQAAGVQKKTTAAVSDASRITVVWRPASSKFTDIAFYEVCLQDAVSKEFIAPWTFGGLRTSWTFVNISVNTIPSGSFTASVRATSSSNQTANVTSAVTQIDSVAPTVSGTIIILRDDSSPLPSSSVAAADWTSASIIIPAPTGSGTALQKQDHLTGMTMSSVLVAWSGATDMVTSGLSSVGLHYDVSLGMSRGGGELLPFTPVTPVNVLDVNNTPTTSWKASVQNVPLSNGIPVFASLRVTDAAGNVAIHAGSTSSTAATWSPNANGFVARLLGAPYRSNSSTPLTVTWKAPGGLSPLEALAIPITDMSNPFIPFGIASYRLSITTDGTLGSDSGVTAANGVWYTVDPATGFIDGTDSYSFTFDADSRSELITYYVVVEAISNAGLAIRTTTLQSVTVDSTAPFIANTANFRSSPATTVASSALTWSWMGAFVDLGSGIASYSVRLWNISNNGSLVADWTPVGLATSYTFSVGLSHNNVYRMQITACNPASLCTTTNATNTIIADSTGPVNPAPATPFNSIFIVGPRPSTAKTSPFATAHSDTGIAFTLLADCTRLQLQWPAFTDGESGMDSYFLSVGTTAVGGTQLLTPTRVGLVTSSTLTNLVIPDGMPIYATVSALNNAGNSTSITTKYAVTCSSSTPSPFKVYDGIVANETTDAGLAKNAMKYYPPPYTSVGCHWSASAVPVSGLDRYVVGIGYNPGTDDIVKFVNVSASTRSYTFSSPLIQRRRRYCTVTAVSRAGLSRTVSSGGANVDTTAPNAIASKVTVGPKAPFVSLPFQRNASTLILCFGGAFSDPESAIARYEVGVATATQVTAAAGNVSNVFYVPDVVAWSPRGTGGTCATVEALTLQSGLKYQGVVRAVNIGGLASIPLFTAAITVDVVGPAILPGWGMFTAGVTTYQDGRDALGIPRYGYLADPALTTTLVSTINATIGGNISDSFTWTPVLTANIPSSLVVSSTQTAGSCQVLVRPLEESGFLLNATLSTPIVYGSSAVITDPAIPGLKLMADKTVKGGGYHVSRCSAGSYRTVFGACAACPPGTYKSAAGDQECSPCGSGTFWATALAQRGGSAAGSSELMKMFFSTNVTGSTTCACLDYLTQDFEPESGSCLCKGGYFYSASSSTSTVPAALIGDLAGQVVPLAPEGQVQKLIDDAKTMCTKCPSGTIKAEMGDGVDMCVACPGDTTPDVAGLVCSCPDSSRMLNPETETCDCVPGLYAQEIDDGVFTCSRCPGPAQYKPSVGDDESLCLRCPFGSMPETETGASCVAADIPGAVMDDVLAAQPVAVCPVGTVHKYLGLRSEIVEGVGLEWFDPFLGLADWYRTKGRICLTPDEDPATGYARITVRDPTNEANKIPFFGVQHDDFFFKGNWMASLDIGSRVDTKKEPIYTAPSTSSKAITWTVEVVQSGMRQYMANYYKNNFASGRDQWDENLDPFIWQDRVARPTVNPTILDTFIGYAVDWRAYVNDADGWEETVVPALSTAMDIVQGTYGQWTNENSLRAELSGQDATTMENTVAARRREDTASLWDSYYEILSQSKDNVKDEQYSLFGGSVGDEPDGIYRVSSMAFSWCKYTKQTPIHACVPCDSKSFNPYGAPISDITADDQTKSDFRYDTGVCTSCPTGVAASAAAASTDGGLNLFAVPEISSLYLDWSKVFAKDIGIGNVTYKFSLGSTPGGAQYVPFTDIGSVVYYEVEGPPSRIGIQSGTPIFVTVVATDALGNPTTFVDTNPVLWDAAGPLPGAVKDATLDAYLPPGSKIVMDSNTSTSGDMQNGTTTTTNTTGGRRLRDEMAKVLSTKKSSGKGGRSLSSSDGSITASSISSAFASAEGTSNRLNRFRKHSLSMGEHHVQALNAANEASFQDLSSLSPSSSLADVATTTKTTVTSTTAADEATVITTPTRRYNSKNSVGGEKLTLKQKLLLKASQMNTERGIARRMEALQAATAAVANSGAVNHKHNHNNNNPVSTPFSVLSSISSSAAASVASAAAAAGVPVASASSSSSSAGGAGSSGRPVSRRLQYGTPVIVEESALVTDSSSTSSTDAVSSSSSPLSYNWRLDTTLYDISYVSDAQFQTTCDTIDITFEAFASAAGVTAYAACVGSNPLNCDVVPALILDQVRTEILTAQTVTLVDLSLPRGQYLYTTVFAVSGAGQVSSVSTNGVVCEDRAPSTEFATVFDTGRYFVSPPSIFGSGRSAKGGISAQDIDCDVMGSGMGASWSGFDLFAGLDHYEWALGTGPGDDDILAWTNVGVSTSIYNNTLVVPSGTAVYASVLAVDKAGRHAIATSDGVLILESTVLRNSTNTSSSSSMNGGGTTNTNNDNGDGNIDVPAIEPAPNTTTATEPSVDTSIAATPVSIIALSSSPMVASHFICHGSPALLAMLEGGGGSDSSGSDSMADAAVGLSVLMGA